MEVDTQEAILEEEVKLEEGHPKASPAPPSQAIEPEPVPNDLKPDLVSTKSDLPDAPKVLLHSISYLIV